MTHPCTDHPCDHCALCESGVCCAGLSAEQRSQLLAVIQTERQAAAFHKAIAVEAQERADHFQQAVAAEAQRTFSLADLVHIEAERQVIGASLHSAPWWPPAGTAALPAAGAQAAPLSIPTRKEPAYVPVARQT